MDLRVLYFELTKNVSSVGRDNSYANDKDAATMEHISMCRSGAELALEMEVWPTVQIRVLLRMTEVREPLAILTVRSSLE